METPQERELASLVTPISADKPDESTGFHQSVGLDRARGRMPDLHRANASFAAKLVKYVRDRYDGDAPRVYHAARINRKTYSAIVGNELRPVSKRTAVAFAFALELPRDEADDLLQSAGFALSPSILEDMVFAACLDAGLHDLDRVNRILEAHGARPFLLQKG